MSINWSNGAAWGSLAGSATQAFGSIMNGISARRQGKVNAELALWQGHENAQRDRKQAHYLMGKGRASIGKSGLMATGSSLDALADLAGEGELTAQQKERQALAQAIMFKSQGSQAMTQGIAGGVNALAGFGSWTNDNYDKISKSKGTS